MLLTGETTQPADSLKTQTQTRHSLDRETVDTQTQTRSGSRPRRTDWLSFTSDPDPDSDWLKL